MVGVSQIVACGISTQSSSGSAASSIKIDQFVYDGANNTFELAQASTKVLDVYIDNGVYPDQVPVGAVTEVIIDAGLLLAGNLVTIKYIV